MLYEEITHTAFSRAARQAERAALKAHHVSREAVSIVMAVRSYVQEVRTETCLVKPGWRAEMNRAARIEEGAGPAHEENTDQIIQKGLDVAGRPVCRAR